LNSDTASNTAKISYGVSLTKITGGDSKALGGTLTYGTAFNSGVASSKTLVGIGSASTFEFTFTSTGVLGTLIADTYKDTVGVSLTY
jgi:hypothetical protein